MPTKVSYGIRASVRSDVGRVRSGNEDAMVVADLTRGLGMENDGVMEFSSGPHGSLFAVADGMGGAAAGELASRACLQALHGRVVQLIKSMRDPDAKAAEQIMIDAVGVANQRVFDLSRTRDEYHGMGTTLTAVLELNGNLLIGQIGDSRAYLIRENEIHRLTRDQTLVAQLVAGGKLTEEEAQRHSHRNVLLQALGVRKSVELAMRNAPLCPGDFLLLCSDGLHTQVSPDEICEIVLDSDGVHDACLELIDLANERGGPDNITSVLVEFNLP
jgi:PPM family protein phosphatase